MNDSAGSPLRLVDDASLSIGDLADRTGVATATLRMWETRYGFPEPTRRRSGHRRYTATDVDLVRRVLDLRAGGIRLDAAIDRITSEHASGSLETPREGAPPSTVIPRGRRETTDPDPSAARSDRSTTETTTTRTTTRTQTTHRSGRADEPSFVPPSSVFAWLRKRHPEAAPQRLGKQTLRQVSWAIEDEFCSRARPGLVFGAFQRAEFLDAARGRWEQVALLADRAYAFAAPAPIAPAPIAPAPIAGAVAPYDGASPILVELPRQHVMSREWCLVADVDGAPAALVAWELPGQAGTRDSERRFEAIWSLDPYVVREAARACASVAADLGAAGATEVAAALAGPVTAPVDADAVTSLFNRVLAYVDGRPR